MVQPSMTSLDPNRESMQSTRLQLNSLQSHQIPVSGTSLPLNDLSDLHIGSPQMIPNGGISSLPSIDPRFSAVYGNPYLRNPHIGLPTPNTANPAATPAPPPYSRDNSSRLVNNNTSGMVTASANIVNTVVANGGNGTLPQVTRLPNSPTTQYIVPNSNVASLKRGTMATHV